MASKMSTAEFLLSMRKVLKSAYEYAGYDVNTHISTTDYLKRENPAECEQPFRVPLRSCQQYIPTQGQQTPPVLPSPASFALSTINIPDISIPDYNSRVKKQLSRPPVVRLKNIGLVELVPRKKRRTDDISARKPPPSRQFDDYDDVNTEMDNYDGNEEENDIEYSVLKTEEPHEMEETAVHDAPLSLPGGSEEAEEADYVDGEDHDNSEETDDFWTKQLQFLRETEQAVEVGLHRREQLEKDKEEYAKSLKTYRENLEALEAKMESWLKIGEEVVHGVEMLVSDGKIQDSYRKKARDWIGLIGQAIKRATAAVEMIQRQVLEVEMEEGIWQTAESPSELSLRAARAERKRVEAYLRGIVEKERQLMATAGAGKRKQVEMGDG